MPEKIKNKNYNQIKMNRPNVCDGCDNYTNEKLTTCVRCKIFKSCSFCMKKHKLYFVQKDEGATEAWCGYTCHKCFSELAEEDISDAKVPAQVIKYIAKEVGRVVANLMTM